MSEGGLGPLRIKRPLKEKKEKEERDVTTEC